MDQENTTTVTPAVTPPAAPAVDPNAIAAAVAAGMAAHSQALESRPAPMTEEQRREYLQVFELDDNYIDGFTAALNDPDATPAQRRAILEQYRDGVVNQSLRGAELFIDQRIEALRQEFQPALTAQAKNQGEAIWNEFTAKHADLKDHRALVDTVANQLYSAGFRPATPEEGFSRAASTVRQLLKLPEPPTANQQAPTTMPRMTPTNTTPSAAGAPPNQPEAGVASFFLQRKK